VQVAGGYRIARWAGRQAAVETLDAVPNGLAQEAYGINERGDLAGRAGLSNAESRGFWIPAGARAAQLLPVLSAALPYAEARGINDARDIVGHAATGDGTRHAVRWRDGRIEDLNDLLIGGDARLAYLDNAIGIAPDGTIAALAALSQSARPKTQGIAILRPV
jgi:probable HAF family extracellular repeat protein